METLGFSIYNTVSPAIMPVLLFPSEFGSLLFLLSCLIAVSGTSSALFNRSGESGHLCLIPDRGGKLPACHCRV